MDLSRLAIAYPADTPTFVYQSVHGACTVQRHVGVRQGTLPHAMFEEPSAVAGDIKSEITRLSHRARDRKCLTRREIVRKLFADATTHCPKGVQLVEKAGI